MARLLLPCPLPIHMHNLSFSSTPIIDFIFLLLAIFSVISIISFFCASSKVKKSLRRLKEEASFQSNQKKLFSKLNSNISSKALSMVKMISWRKEQAGGEGEEDDHDFDDYSDEAVWRKTIMMGERCRPLDFSGKIAYDSQGNLLADLPHDQDQSKKYISVEKS
jgi:hypothetical protein